MRNKKARGIISLLTVFLLISSLFPQFGIIAKAADTAGPLPTVDTYAVVVGDFLTDQGLGDNWTPKNTSTLMKEYSKGIYELTVDFKTAKTYSYKVAFNGQWDKPAALGNPNNPDKSGNIALNVTTPGKVTFKVDYSAQKVYDSINDPAQFKTAATVTGSLVQAGGKDWTPSDTTFQLDYKGEGTYSKTFPLKAGNYEYKIAYNLAWSNGETGSNVKFTLAKDQDVTFVGNPDLGICTDSINTPSITSNLSIIGSVRNTSDSNASVNWQANAKGYEFSYFTGDGKYIYSNYYKAGSYQYKGINNYNWDGTDIPKSGNVNLTVPDDKVNGGTYVTFIADEVKGTIIDSINNPTDVALALGLQKPAVTLVSPQVNANDTISFNYKNDSAKSVYLAGTMNGWSVTATPMSKDANGIWTTSVRLGDAAITGAYKFVVDGVYTADPANTAALDKDGNSTFSLPAFSGRKVVIAGDIQAALGYNSWDPASDKTKLNYDGNGSYSLTLKNVKPGDYQYKIAMGGTWDPENYGANGKSYGDNIKISVPKTEDITFYYNDDSHFIQDSINYQKLDIGLTGTGITVGTKLQDTYLTGIYKASITFKEGTYSDIKAVLAGTEYSFSPIEVTDASKVVTFSFEPKTKLTFTNISSNKIDLNSLLYNSRSEIYKSPYGATKLGDPINFNLQAAKGDLTVAKLVVESADGTKVIDMNKNGTFDYDTKGAYDKWSVTYTPPSINMYTYYFVVSNGSDVEAYGDSTGYYGVGKGGELGTVGKYGFNVYDPSYKTPDWMKNAVVYQIFPDRFFNGDTSNDYLQKLSRGTASYEFYSNWYSLPESPNDEYKKDANGNLIPNPDYKGTKGDGNFSNEMYGGDLKGIQDKLTYLQSLGVNTLYINPISQSISNHRYDTTDYTKVDPLLGYEKDFTNLTTEATSRGMHVILDGVFNHVADDSVYFDRYGKYMAKGKPIGAYQYWSRVYDLMNTKGLNQQDAEKQVTADLASQGITDLHYKDWFDVYNTKVAAVSGDPEHYQYTGWDGYDSLPIIKHLNGSEYNIKSWADEIIDGPNANSKQWLKNGASGWRLDVANEIADDVWPHFRAAVKGENANNVIIGEIWTDASKYLLGDKFDSVMNYRFRGAVLDFVNGDSANAAKAMNELEMIREQYPTEAFQALMNLVDSHDTGRILSALDGNTTPYAPAATDAAKAKMRLVPLLQMTYPGAPTIYYGDEAGMVGGSDPDCRRTMIWGEGDKAQVDWYAELANIRNNYSVLRTGDIVPVNVPTANAANIMAFTRNDSTNHALVAINNSKTAVTDLTLSVPSIPDGTVLTNALNKAETYTVSNGAVKINVPALSGDILVAKYTAVTVNEAGLKDAYDPSFKVADKAVVPSDSTVISNIDKTAANSNVTVSSTNEEVSKAVLDEAKSKSVIPVITRGDTTFTFKDNNVITTIDNAGVTGLTIAIGNTLTNETAAKAIVNNNSATLLKELKFDNNLPNGQFGGKVTVNTPIDIKYAGKTLYVYYLNPSNNTAELIASPVADANGNITFDVTHFSDYFVTDKLLSVTTTTTPTTTPGSSTTTPSSSTTTATKKLVQTGAVIDSTVLIAGGLVVIMLGIIIIAVGKKKEA